MIFSGLKNILAGSGSPISAPKPIGREIPAPMALVTTGPTPKMRPRAEVIVQGGGITSASPGGSIYSGSDFSGVNDDFAGDWRSADSWMRQDLWRVRNRSRWLERANPWMQAFKAAVLANVLGSEGIHSSLKVFNAPNEPDANKRDGYAERMIKAARDKFEKKENFSTHKRLDAVDMDKLLLSRLIFDGEFFVVRKPGFANDCGFSWQVLDADYCDHNLNRTLENGNIIKMGIELDAEYKFPVAIWFSYRRPNDYFYNYNTLMAQRYYRVPIQDCHHVYLQTMDADQVRGFPLPFAAMTTLYREGRFEEAALVNAVTGACRTTVYEKDFPEGISGQNDIDELSEADPGRIIDRMEPGTALELPYGLTAKTLDSQYPNGDFGPFVKTMLRASAASVGMTYMGMTGDVSEANFSSLRAGKDDERENWKGWQSFFIRNWKEKERSEWLYQALMTGQVPLPLSKFAKYDVTQFTGRRWTGVNPQQDAQTNVIRLNNRETSISAIIRESSQRDPEEVFAEIAEDEARMKELGIERIVIGRASNDEGTDEEAGTPTPPEPTPPKPKAKKSS